MAQFAYFEANIGSMYPSHGITSPSNTGRLGALDARAKILAFTAILFIAVSTPPERVWAFAGYTAVLVVAASLARLSPRHLLLRLAVVLPVLVASGVFMPLTHAWANPRGEVVTVIGLPLSWQGLVGFWNVSAKAVIGVLCAATLMASTPLPELLEGLRRLRVPSVLVTMVGFTHRFTFVLVDEVVRMKRARDSRCYGGTWLWHGGVLGNMVGTLFLRVHERAERVYNAMLARGFDGHVVGSVRQPMAKQDYVFVLTVAAIVAGLRFYTP